MSMHLRMGNASHFGIKSGAEITFRFSSSPPKKNKKKQKNKKQKTKQNKTNKKNNETMLLAYLFVLCVMNISAEVVKNTRYSDQKYTGP